MKTSIPLQEDKKLCVTYRVEPGCLGPKGKRYISEFCSFAQSQLRSLDSEYIAWNIIPRKDKALPEMQYNIVGKRMTHSQAEKYLVLFDQSLDEFEGHLCEKLATLINEFMAH
mgnify:CR=1 FL=1